MKVSKGFTNTGMIIAGQAICLEPRRSLEDFNQQANSLLHTMRHLPKGGYYLASVQMKSYLNPIG